MRQRINLIFALSLLAPFAAQADPIAVTFEIVHSYSDPNSGYSASWLHTASSAPGTGANTGDTLYMNGSAFAITGGEVSGTLDGGIFTITGGHLNVFGKSYEIYGSSLGGSFADSAAPVNYTDLNWVLNIEHFGSFYFEDMGMGPTGPNYMGDDHFVLWGQNSDAYSCNSYSTVKGESCYSWGMDLYGKRVAVPEPGTLALFGIGLFGLALANRRRRIPVTNG